MAQPNVLLTLPIVAEQSIRSDGTGSGADFHAPVGKSGSLIYRALVRVALPAVVNGTWVDPNTAKPVYQIVKATYFRRTDAEVHVANGGTPHVTLRALLAAFKEAGGGKDSANSGSGAFWYTTPANGGTTWSNQPGVVGVLYDSGVLSAAHGKWQSWDVTPDFERIAPSSILKSDGVRPCDGQSYFGWREASVDESASSHTIEWNSRRQTASNSAGYVLLEVSTDAPPLAPTVAYLNSDGTPALDSGSTKIIASSSGTGIGVQWTQNDPDTFDQTIWREHQFLQDGATDAAPGRPFYDLYLPASPPITGNKDFVILPASVLVLHPPRAAFMHRLRTCDTSVIYGAFSPVQRCQTAFFPGKPTGLYFQTTSTTSPSIGASLVSADPGDYVTGADIIVTKGGVAGGTITLWSAQGTAGSPGIPIGGTSSRAQFAYQGNQLNPGDSFQYIIRLYNRDGIPGPYSDVTSVTMLSVTGPTGMFPIDRNTKILSPLGPLTIADVGLFDQYWRRIYRNGAMIDPGSLVVIGSAVYTIDTAIPAGLINFGENATITWDAAIRPAGNSDLDPFSPQYPIAFITLPQSVLGVSA